MSGSNRPENDRRNTVYRILLRSNRVENTKNGRELYRGLQINTGEMQKAEKYSKKLFADRKAGEVCQAFTSSSSSAASTVK